MGTHLLTGHAGTPHVTSDDQRHQNAVMHGAGAYIAEGCACTISGPNVAHIGDGMIIANGAFVRVTGGGVDVPIASGAVGETRTDYIVLRYSVASSGIESAEIVCKKGARGAGGNILNGATAAEFEMYSIDVTSSGVGTPRQVMQAFSAPGVLGLGELAMKSSIAASDVPSLDASKITGGTFDAARIPNLNASKVTAGTFSADRIPTLASTKVSGLTDAAKAGSWIAASNSNDSNWAWIKFSNKTCVAWKRITGQSTGTRSRWNNASWVAYGATTLSVGSYPFTITDPVEIVSMVSGNQDGTFPTNYVKNTTTSGGSYYIASINLNETKSVSYDAYVFVTGKYS